MSTLRVTNLKGGSAGSAPNLPDGANVTGVITATSFSGSGANLTGIDATTLKDGGGSVKVQATATGAVVTGVLTATTGSFTGNVSVGGTLTYEDVTNVDSVGMVTARNGVKVLAGGINAVGVITATGYSGDGSGLTGLSGFTATASTISGAIEANKPIVINADGTVGVITGFQAVLGAPTNIDTASSTYFETNMNTGIGLVGGEGKFVIGFKDGQNNRLWAKVGTVGSDLKSITFGSRIQVNGTNTWGAGDIVHIPGTNKVAFLFADNSNSQEGSCVIGEVSGTSITVGSKTTFRSGSACYNIRGVWDPDTNKLLVAYRDGGASNGGSLSIGTVSGNSCTFSGHFNFSNNEIISSSANRLGIAYDTKNNQVVINYLPQTANTPMFAVGTISGSTATFSSTQNPTFGSASNPNRLSCVYDEESDVITFISRHDIDGVNKMVVRAGRGVSVGSSIPYALGAQVVVDTKNSAAGSGDIVYNSTSGKSVISYADGSDSDYMYTAVVNVGLNTSVTLGSVTAINAYKSDNHANQNLGYNAAINRILIVVKRDGEGGGGGGGDAFIQGVRVTNVTPGNFIGFSADAYTNGQTASVKIVGQKIQGQSNLLVGNRYFVLGDGTLGTVNDGEGIIAGISVSTTDLLVKG